jgi:hypothetical protein
MNLNNLLPWLAKLPPDFARLARHRLRTHPRRPQWSAEPPETFGDVHHALNWAFDWSATPEGWEWWEKVGRAALAPAYPVIPSGALLALPDKHDLNFSAATALLAEADLITNDGGGQVCDLEADGIEPDLVTLSWSEKDDDGDGYQILDTRLRREHNASVTLAGCALTFLDDEDNLATFTLFKFWKPEPSTP